MGYENIIVQNLQTKSSNIDAMSFYEFLKSNPLIKKIPNYQRPYSWGEEQVKVLFSDLDKVIRTSSDEWFFGPLFTTQSNNSNNITELEILDGQQRITTVILLLRVLCVIENSLKDSWVWSDKMSDTDKEDLKKSYKAYKKIIEDCLISVSMETGTQVNQSRFLTDLSSRKVFSNWITNITKIQTSNNYQEFKHLQNIKDGKFALTKERINKNLDLIYEVIEGKANEIDGLIKINNLINCILYKLYIINVPLYKSSSVLEIFETLNNRGKPLNLTDLIRFRTLVDAKEEDKTEIEIIWHDIFELHQNLEKRNLFKGGMNDFFEKYINSISEKSNGYTKDADRLERFVKLYKREGGSLEELQKVKNVLHLFNWIFTTQKNGMNRFVTLFRGDEKIKVEAILKVLYHTMIASETAIVPMCSYLRNKVEIDIIESNSGDAQRKVTVNFFFELIKVVISLDIFQRIPSNERRNIYIGYAIKYRSVQSTEHPVNIYKNLKSYEKLKQFKHSFFQNLILIKNDSRNEKYNLLVLHFIQLLFSCKNFDFPTNYVLNDDHIIPQKWYKNNGWSKTITKDSLIKSIDSIEDKNYKDSFNEMLREDLWNDKSSKESFIQLIGNKWYIHYKENIKASDIEWKDFIDKKGNEKPGKRSIYMNYKNTPNSYFFIPTIEDPIENKSFGIREVIKRTIVFYEIIKENSDLNWNSLNVD